MVQMVQAARMALVDLGDSLDKPLKDFLQKYDLGNATDVQPYIADIIEEKGQMPAFAFMVWCEWECEVVDIVSDLMNIKFPKVNPFLILAGLLGLCEECETA